MLVHAEKKRHVETMKDPRRKDGFRGITNIGPVLEVKVTHDLYQYGIEIKVDSMQNDGSHSLRGSGLQYEETRCDKTEGAIHTILIIFVFDDCCSDRSTFLPLDTLVKNPSMSRRR